MGSQNSTELPIFRSDDNLTATNSKFKLKSATLDITIDA
jgi:hypothetical protein